MGAFANDFLQLPNGGDAYNSNCSLALSIGILARRIQVWRDILVSNATVEVTALVAASFFGVGIYDLGTAQAIALFNGFLGSINRASSVSLNTPVVLKAGVYLLAYGGDNAGGFISVRGNPNDTVFSSAKLTVKATPAIGAGGILPANLAPLISGISGGLSSTCPYVFLT